MFKTRCQVCNCPTVSTSPSPEGHVSTSESSFVSLLKVQLGKIFNKVQKRQHPLDFLQQRWKKNFWANIGFLASFDNLRWESKWRSATIARSKWDWGNNLKSLILSSKWAGHQVWIKLKALGWEAKWRLWSLCSDLKILRRSPNYSDSSLCPGSQQLPWIEQ